MTRRGRVWVTICAVAVVLPPSLWFATRPRVPVEFVGEAPEFEFIHLDEFNGKPLVDFKLPGGGRVVYPNKRRFIPSEEIESGQIAGFLLFQTFAEKFRLNGSYRVAGEDVSAWSNYVDDGRSLPVLMHRGIIPGVPITPVPYATAEEFREVTLSATKTWKLRLPLGEGVGSSKRKPTNLTLGPLSISLNPRPWKLTTAPLSYRVVTKVPAGKIYLLHLRWIENYPDDFYIILEGNVDAPFLVENGVPQQRFIASLTELRPEQLNVRVRRKHEYNIELFLPSGKKIYGGGGAHHLSELGFTMLEFRSKRVLNNGIELKSGGHSLMATKDGERTVALGYRAGKVWKETSVFDTPPAFRDSGGRNVSGYSTP